MSQLIEFAGQVVRALPDDLPPGVMQDWISKPHALSEALRKALVTPLFPMWKKTITLGALRSTEAYLEKLDVTDHHVSEQARDIIAQPAFTVANEETEVELVKVSVAELGFPDGARLADIYERAGKFGLGLNPPEVGPALRLDYLDQPRAEWLIVAMEPIAGSDGSLGLFHVSCAGMSERSLGYWSPLEEVWGSLFEFLFQLK